MAKRFTSTDKWDKEWFQKLKPKHKCLWLFLCDKCDQAGVWDINFSLAEFLIGEKITESDMGFFGERVVKISADKYFISTFIQFQYGTLSKDCKPHTPVFKSLEKNNINLESLPKGYSKGIHTLKEKEEEKDKDKDMDKDKEKDKEKEPKKSSELHAKFIEVFADFYFDLHQMKYQFQSGKDGTAVKQLIGKVQTTVSERRPDYVDSDILGAFKFILNNLNDWFKSQGCSLSVINGKYNEIIAGIKTQKTKTNGGLSTEYLSDLKNRLQGN